MRISLRAAALSLTTFGLLFAGAASAAGSYIVTHEELSYWDSQQQAIDFVRGMAASRCESEGGTPGGIVGYKIGTSAFDGDFFSAEVSITCSKD